jgi:hypothetical protein
MSVGNLTGGDIYNLFDILRVASIIREMPVDAEARTNILLLVSMVILVTIFMRTSWKIVQKKRKIIFFSDILFPLTFLGRDFLHCRKNSDHSVIFAAYNKQAFSNRAFRCRNKNDTFRGISAFQPL